MPSSARGEKFAQVLRAIGAVSVGALVLCWPAWLSGYPLLYPDSMSYLGDGRHVAGELFLLHARTYHAMRSELFSLGIFFAHWNWSAWPVVLLQAVMVAYVLRLAVRSVVPRRTDIVFLPLIALLSLLTSVSWYSSLVMPDVLGPVAYVGLYLLVFARGALSRAEVVVVSLLTWWGLAAHASHLVIAAVICGVLALVWLCQWQGMKGRGRALAYACYLLLAVVAAQMALHAYLYGKPTLTGNRMPYTMARVIADGPGKWYLQEHCARLDWAICTYVDRLPDSDDAFLWDEDGVWVTASAEQKQRMLAEETPLVVAAVREYPKAQLQKSAANFWSEFSDFGLWDFCPNDYLTAEIDRVLPGVKSKYLATREQRGTLPVVTFTAVLNWVVSLSAAFALGMLPWMMRRRAETVKLALVLLPVVVVNALLTAVLSEPDSRYQCRVVWLAPLVACLMVAELLRRRVDGAIE